MQSVLVLVDGAGGSHGSRKMQTLTRTVHLHASHKVEGAPDCSTVCGLPCDAGDVAYRGLDPERVTCVGCSR